MSERGFTLIELLVVMAVLVLVVAAMPIAFSGGFAGASLKSSARLVADELRRVRGRAIAENAEFGLAIDPQNRRFSMVPDGRAGRISGEAEIKLSDAAGKDTAATIMFFPDGSSTGGRITLTRDAQHYEITIDWLTGRIAVAD